MGTSPAVRLMGRRTKTLLPINWNLSQSRDAAFDKGKIDIPKIKQAKYQNKSDNTRNRKDLRKSMEGPVLYTIQMCQMTIRTAHQMTTKERVPSQTQIKI